jgi:preprotein translocase subunit SecD
VTYVGDARLSGFPIGETRLLAYALDEKIVVERDAAQSDRLASGTIVQGALRFSRVVRQTTTYRVKGPAKEPRQLVIVQRRLPGWSLVKPDAKTVELSEGNYRIPFQLPGGPETQTVEVVQEQTQQQELRLVNGAADQIRVYAQAREFDAKTREALTKILQLQAAVADAERKVTLADNQRQQIVDEQARLRDNLERVPANSDLQRRYLATLDKQETDLEAIAKRRADAEKGVEAAREALRGYVAQLG